MRTRPEAQEWYFFKAGSDAGLKAGPFSWERLLVQAQEGVLEPTDVVWDPNSGWKTAAQIPGLFPVVTSPGAAGTGPETPPQGPSAEDRGRSRLYWVSALVALVIVGGGLGVYFGFVRDGDEASATTTTIPVATTQSTPATGTATTTDGGSMIVYLDKGDYGHEVALHVGDRVRIDLKPWVGDKVKSVWWDFRPVMVQKTDSGSETVGTAVVASWLELKAVAVGPVTVRAEYQYPNGTSKATWVVYLFVRE